MIDHRKLGRELDLFDSDPLIGAGLPFWLPAGAAARHEVESYLRELERRAGYQHVYSPAMGKRQMYEMSGHWSHFAADMFPPMPVGDDELVLRPSLCPHHALIFKARRRSYRELPLRIAEMGQMYRQERSGVLGGLSRVRAIALNDAHVLCAPEQAAEEVGGVLRLMREAHDALGLRPASVRLSLRGPGRRYGGPESGWALSERLLRGALADNRMAYVVGPGEAAFYGPKIDVQVADAAGREWTIATVQLDFHQPERFDLSYVSASGARARPVMVHRSLAGSMERLFGQLIEEHQGAFPVWYAPVQVAVLPVGASGTASFAADAVAAGLRAVEVREGSLGARIRAAAKVPYVAVIGAREAAAGLVSLRLRDGRQLDPMPGSAAIALISAVAAARRPGQLLPSP
ncbi:threonyl-tRNA synthetase [Actinoplanes sp. SE50]|uniref:threonine--tRNA ligase n=1 Tax=unclassified Actinoplanes TaxID=2626549 RepID=UPI00023EDED5|nr:MULTISPECIES: threonine--tRNA ligase [unclassified Actinoplanes]AEV88237.1 threonyl-tRNA synthetase [Actinoplanes sp. SE50/110]ATO86642.1 threonyl-tRNA synthetase [Actinoplanes sp. SE50]SLM04059.1 threonine--tRNA ligase [Actinoplanes sp. SE50/110]